jgi:solute carrier family 35 (UDP-xylose/UDP-N-acetylglucosamine transporter), member B4
MARRRRADSSSTTHTSSLMTTSRRRSTLRDLQSTPNDGDVIVPKVINAAPSLEKAQMFGIEDPRPASSRMLAMAGRIFIETIPQWLAIGAMLGLIFGGCCSNVSEYGRNRVMMYKKEAYDSHRFLRWKLLYSESFLCNF